MSPPLLTFTWKVYRAVAPCLVQLAGDHHLSNKVARHFIPKHLPRLLAPIAGPMVMEVGVVASPDLGGVADGLALRLPVTLHLLPQRRQGGGAVGH